MKPPSPEYAERKARFGRCLTIYGRKPVLEALQCAEVRCERLHLARSNREAAILDEIVALARSKGAELREHDRPALAHISRNAREDQGVAADLRWPGYRQFEDFLEEPATALHPLLAVDGITNPQNLGMLIRSAAAAGSALLLPREGNCDISPLVIKASAGTVFRASIIRCNALPQALGQLRAGGWHVAALAAGAGRSLFDALAPGPRVFVLGGASTGLTAETLALANERLSIPMANGVESLNVAVTGALVAYRSRLPR